MDNNPIIATLITDRTIADYLRWKSLRDKGWANMTEAEREEWSGDMKGSYNASDLNRVGKALNYIRERLVTAGYLSQSVFTAKMDWGTSDVPTASDLTYYLDAVRSVRGALTLFATTPAAPTDVGGLDYLEANNIEQILVDVDQLIDNMLAARYYCGELYAGEV